MGGVNYFRNLFEALRKLPSCSVEPVVVAGFSSDASILDSLGAAEKSLYSWAGSQGLRWKVRRAMTLGLGRDFIFERYLKARHIQLVSHMGYLGKRAKIPSLVWIPDFQERYFPEFFSAGELESRARENRNVVLNASAILLSSEHAREGLAQISADAAARAYVLPFVASVPQLAEMPSHDSLMEKYNVPENYFFLPNQFWKHKNHEVVIRALGLLKKNGTPMTVIATGNPRDHRQPEHAEYLMRLVATERVEDEFRTLGMVPYADLMGLMANAMAVVNPSLFEGWSSTVEESKSLGKMLVISDIPVHREQAHERVMFFDSHRSDQLSEALLKIKGDYRPEIDREFMRRARERLPDRLQAFARQYEKIVHDVVGDQVDSAWKK